jgi:membrane associated rhomboid family serine protease
VADTIASAHFKGFLSIAFAAMISRPIDPVSHLFFPLVDARAHLSALIQGILSFWISGLYSVQ